MLLMKAKSVIVALDYSSSKDALNMASRLDPKLCRVKVGKELFVAEGPPIVEKLQAMGFDLFLDLKFHDIPNTTVQACKAAAELGVWMLNVHASGGPKMLEAVANSFVHTSAKPLLIGVTVLTSMNQLELHATGITSSLADHVLELASLVHEAGLDGVVCSAHEALLLKERFGKDFCLVTPGIRPIFSNADDQKRISTPLQALTAGSDYLVIGRAITAVPDPLLALERIQVELERY